MAAEAEKGGDLRGGPVAAATPNAASFGPAAFFFVRFGSDHLFRERRPACGPGEEEMGRRKGGFRKRVADNQGRRASLQPNVVTGDENRMISNPLFLSFEQSLLPLTSPPFFRGIGGFLTITTHLEKSSRTRRLAKPGERHRRCFRCCCCRCCRRCRSSAQLLLLLPPQRRLGWPSCLAPSTSAKKGSRGRRLCAVFEFEAPEGLAEKALVPRKFSRGERD